MSTEKKEVKLSKWKYSDDGTFLTNKLNVSNYVGYTEQLERKCKLLNLTREQIETFSKFAVNISIAKCSPHSSQYMLDKEIEKYDLYCKKINREDLQLIARSLD
jgi:hypothetical protein